MPLSKHLWPSSDSALRALGWLDPLLGSALAAAVMMLLATAWPGTASAADRRVGNGQAASEQRQTADFDTVQTNNRTVRVQGSGDVRLTDLAVGALSVSVRGSGDVVASGTAPRLSINIAGSGDVKTRDLQAEGVSVHTPDRAMPTCRPSARWRWPSPARATWSTAARPA